MFNENIIMIFFFSVFSLVIGFLISSLLKGRQLVLQKSKIEQSERLLQENKNHLFESQKRIEEIEKVNHQHEVSTSRINEQLHALQLTEQRLLDEINKYKDELISVKEKTQEDSEKYHTATTQYEKEKATSHVLSEQLREFKDTTATQESEYKKLQAQHNNLSNQHAEMRALLDQREEYLSEQARELENYKKEIVALREKMQEIYQKNHDSSTLYETEKAANKSLREQVLELKSNVDTQQADYKKLRTDHYTLSNEYTELKTTLSRREEYFQEQIKQFSETKQAFTKEFENLANKIFEEKGNTFTIASQSSINGLLKPFREQIEGFQKRINEVHDASQRDSSHLNAEIRKVLDIGLKMSEEANNLTSALKGDSQQRGAWGEAQLRRTLEMSGLVENTHYEVQSSFKDLDGKQKQTDYLIKLPDNQHIIIDSKVTLNAYDKATSATSPEDYQRLMDEHLKAVRRHIDDLASKDYTSLVGISSPSFVLMFMPIEPAYIEALKSNKDLFEYGYRKSIVLVSHTTLIPILRTVSNLWMIERSNTEAQEISESAGDIYNQVCIVADHLNRLGGTLKTVSNHYNRAVTSLAGQQGLYGKVERFNQLSTKVNKSLPSLEPTHIDFESERLSLIVEPIEEN